MVQTSNGRQCQQEFYGKSNESLNGGTMRAETRRTSRVRDGCGGEAGVRQAMRANLNMQVGDAATASYGSISTHMGSRHMMQGRFMLRSGICRSHGSFPRPTHTLTLHLLRGLKFDPPGLIHHCANLDLLPEHC